MKRALALAVLVLAAAVLVFGATHYDPRRPRPEGWEAPWRALPLEPETSWAPDALKRGVVQRLFAQATDELTECSQEYFRAKVADVVPLELLLEAGAEGVRLAYVVTPPRADLPAGLLPCLERAIEKSKPVAGPGLAPGTRWRLGLSFLLNPVSDLPSPPWWERFVPASWRSGGSSGIHVG